MSKERDSTDLKVIQAIHKFYANREDEAAFYMSCEGNDLFMKCEARTDLLREMFVIAMQNNIHLTAIIYQALLEVTHGEEVLTMPKTDVN